MLETPPTRISPRALILGILAYVLLTVLMIYAIETIGVERIRAIIEDAGPLAPLLYMAIKALTYIFAPLSSGPIQLSSGVLFGLWGGTFYTVLGELAGGTISFLIARYLGRPIVERFVGQEGMGRVDNFVGQLGGWRTLIYARLFLFAIYDFISYAAGLTRKISLHQYVIVSGLLGIIPTFLFVAAGASLAGNREMVILLYVGIVVLSLIPLVLQWWRQRQAQSRPTDH